MKTISQFLSFTYDGISSKEYDLLRVSSNTGLFEEELSSERTIEKVSSKHRTKSTLKSIKNEDIVLELSVAYKGKWKDSRLEEIINWLSSEYYKPLIFEGYENRIFYCMRTGSIAVNHTGNNEGYINFTMDCNSPYVFSDLKKKDIENNSSVTLNNSGIGIAELFIQLKVNSDGECIITKNHADFGEYNVKIKNLKKDETIIIQTEKESIESDMNNVYHYNDVTGDLSKLSLRKGETIISLSGDVKMSIAYQEYFIR